MSCACTTCHVIVREGFDSLGEMDESEEDLLDRAWGLTPTSRLSCQAILSNQDVTIETAEVHDQPRPRKPLTRCRADERPGHRELVRRDRRGAGVASAATSVPRLRAQALHSQVDMHQAYGGVVPELASRDHIRRVLPLTRQVLAEAGCAARRHRPRGLHARARAWPAPCWSAPAWPRRWPRRWGGRRWACTTSKGICCRRSCRPTHRSFPSSRCWCPVATRS